MKYHSGVRFKQAVFLSSLISSRQFSSNALNIVVLVGSTRTSGPPRPILSDRVSRFIESSLKGSSSKHHVSILTAKDLPLMEKPHFAYAKSQIPDQLVAMHDILIHGDALTCRLYQPSSQCQGLVFKHYVPRITHGTGSSLFHTLDRSFSFLHQRRKLNFSAAKFPASEVHTLADCETLH